MAGRHLDFTAAVPIIRRMEIQAEAAKSIPMAIVLHDALKNPNVQPYKGKILLKHSRTDEETLIADKIWIELAVGEA